MIVCVCNRLNDSKIRTAVESGAASADEVYTRCGVRKNCGRCQQTIEDMLDARALLAAAQ
jgi:bacterioferritin-associated ferredoxin